MAEYNHLQSVSSASWVISHNLAATTIDTDAFIDVSGSLTKVLPLNVVHTDNNTLTVTFSANQVGRVRIVSI